MKAIKLLLIAMSILLINVSCKKAGTGGKATIVTFLKHHGKTIPSVSGHPDTVFVKFNANELPGTKASDFDTYFIGEVGEDHVHLEELKKGKYYLYGVGWDTDINQRVTGGMAIKIKWSERKKEIDTDLAVTE
ncbi:MAG: hypothetical protein ACJ76F_04275 [Bacteroidia bacterium]